MLLNSFLLFKTLFKIWRFNGCIYADFFVILSACVQNEARVSFAIKTEASSLNVNVFRF